MGQKKKAEYNTLTVRVVSHTHWDREWYHTAAIFRQRLVPLIDGLLASLRADPKLRFLLDGQAVILEDYLAVRPESGRALAMHLRSGSVEAGPWYVLADELIPTGEALLRNLLAGKRILDSMNARIPKVLYCPDSFGHPASLPAIAMGFGCELIILWRGFGGASHPAANCVAWRAPDGSTAVIYHLPRDGYEVGAELPRSTTDAVIRWEGISEALRERDRLGVVLLTNGADHHALQEASHDAIRLLSQVAKPDTVIRSSLSGFAESLLRQTRRRTLPAVHGELRDSYGYTWTLQGTFASRSQLKRSLGVASRILSRDAEPWSALAAFGGHSSRRALIAAAWKPLLLSLPHDTLCGCSVDEVATEAALRLRDAADQGRQIVRDSLEDLAGYDRASIRRRPYDPNSDVVIICNPAARARGGVAEVSFVQKRRDIRVGPGSVVQPRGILRAPVPKSFSVARDSGEIRLPAQLIGTHSRYDLLESPHHYPDADIVMDRRVLVWTPAIPAYGFDSVKAGAAVGSGDILSPDNPAHSSERSIGNGLVSAGITNDSRVWFALDEESVAGEPGRTAKGMGRGKGPIAFVSVEDCYDAGDLYTASLRHSPTVIERVRTWKVDATGPLRSSLVARYEWASQVEKTPSSAIVTGGSAGTPKARPVRRSSQLRGWLQATFSVDADRALVRVQVKGDNRTKHHRLRLVISSDLGGCRTYADAAFAVVERVPPVRDSSADEMEIPPATAPLHRFVSLLNQGGGMSVFSDGVSEYESTASGAVSLTLIRAVGELSRHDLPERPGHAGWPANTPLAQEQGPFRCGFAWMPHTSGDWDTLAEEVQCAADDFLHPLSGITLRSAITTPARFMGAELTGKGLAVSAIKESEDGRSLLLRCVNLTSQKVAGSWELGHPVRSATLARLDESPQKKLSVKRGKRIPFSAAPNGIVTILVR